MRATIIQANITTLDDRLERADAVLLAGGVIQDVGTCENLTASAPGAEMLDWRDRYLTPGLTDAHIHLVGYGFSLQQINLENTTSSNEAVLRVCARISEFADGWVLGRGFNINQWSDSVYPTAAMLDAVSEQQPIALRSRDGHSLWVNSAALRAANIHEGTPDPDGGRIVRDTHGEPTGTLLENAMRLVTKVQPAPTLEDAVRACELGAGALRRYGFTAVHTMALEPNLYLLAMQESEARGELPLRVWACVPHADLEHLEALGVRGSFGRDTGARGVRLAGVKFFADGALGSRTALMHEDYLSFPGERGIAVDAPETVLERGRRALELGFSPVIHAIGDRANSQMLDVLEQLAPLAQRRNIRLRLEHAQHLTRADVERFARLGIVVSAQPIQLPGDTATIDRLLGAERAELSYAFRDVLATGAEIALGSDAPVATPDPVAGFEAAVQRLGADGQPWHTEQAMTRLETLRGYTRGAALAAGWDGWYGRIAPGCAADFTVWDNDPLVDGAKPAEALRL
jgi:predicted amidohydrolase YtcJ